MASSDRLGGDNAFRSTTTLWPIWTGLSISDVPAVMAAIASLTRPPHRGMAPLSKLERCAATEPELLNPIVALFHERD